MTHRYSASPSCRRAFGLLQRTRCRLRTDVVTPWGDKYTDDCAFSPCRRACVRTQKPRRACGSEEASVSSPARDFDDLLAGLGVRLVMLELDMSNDRLRAATARFHCLCSSRRVGARCMVPAVPGVSPIESRSRNERVEIVELDSARDLRLANASNSPDSSKSCLRARLSEAPTSSGWELTVRTSMPDSTPLGLARARLIAPQPPAWTAQRGGEAAGARREPLERGGNR